MKTFLKLVIVLTMGILAACNQENITIDENNILEIEDLGYFDLDSIVFNNLTCDSFIIDNYTRDAKLNYIHLLLSNENHPNYNDPNLDYSDIKKILQLIQSVYNLDSPERDTVFQIYPIHSFYNYSFNNIGLNVVPDLPEFQNLANGIIPTGNDQLDNLLIDYGLDSITYVFDYPNNNPPSLFIHLRTRNEYNMIAVANQFNALPEVKSTSFSGHYLDCANIEVIIQKGSVLLDFSKDITECVAFSGPYAHWVFEIIDEEAKFIRRYID